MDGLKYKKAVKTIACIDLVFSVITLVWNTFATMNTDVPNQYLPKINLTSRQMEKLVAIFWTSIFIVNIIQLLIALALYAGTLEKEARKAMSDCKLWYKTAIFLIVFPTAEFLRLLWFTPGVRNGDNQAILSCGFCLGEIFFRLIGAYIVHQFVKELEVAAPVNLVQQSQSVYTVQTQ